jgi:hypothetical protein
MMTDTEKAMKENMKKFSKSRVLRVKLDSAWLDSFSVSVRDATEGKGVNLIIWSLSRIY